MIFSELPCPEQPPDALPGEGTERTYGPDVTKYRCKNGYKWKENEKLVIVGLYLEVECLNKKWTPKNLPDCIRMSYIIRSNKSKHFETRPYL